MFTTFDQCIILFILFWSLSHFIKVYLIPCIPLYPDLPYTMYPSCIQVYHIPCITLYPGLPYTMYPHVSMSTLYHVSPLYLGLPYTMYPHVSMSTLYPPVSRLPYTMYPPVSRSTLYHVSPCIQVHPIPCIQVYPIPCIPLVSMSTVYHVSPCIQVYPIPCIPLYPGLPCSKFMYLRIYDPWFLLPPLLLSILYKGFISAKLNKGAAREGTESIRRKRRGGGCISSIYYERMQTWNGSHWS